MNTLDQLDDLGAFIALTRAHLLPVDRLAAFAGELGSAVELLRWLGHGEITGTDGQLALGLFDDASLHAAQRDADNWRHAGHEIRTIFDTTYPANLREIVNRPPFVFVRGQWNDALDSRAIAIVGTRQASPYGLQQAKLFATEAARHDITVVSGLARGIDAAAHEAALLAGGRTTAVLGTGINRTYPGEHAALAKRIAAEAGALISQFLPDQPPTQWTFPKRNVVMSGLTWATVVIEASWTSGARVQATEALRHGRTVFLLRSLIESHEWARAYVTEGKFGVRAQAIDSVDALLDAMTLDSVAA